MNETHQTITAVGGIEVGQVTDPAGLTGCTVVRCRKGAVGGVDQREGAPGTRETDLVRPLHMVEKVHGVLLATGEISADVNLVSAYGAGAVAQAVVRAVRMAGGAGGLPAHQDLQAGA